MNEQIDAGAYISELTAQRNVLADQLAAAGARIQMQAKALADKDKEISALQKTIAEEFAKRDSSQ